MEQYAEGLETIILGNSYAMHGIIPDSLGENSFNLAFGGNTLVYDHFLFFKWSMRYNKLKTVIHSLNYKTFYEGSYGVAEEDDIQETTYKVQMGCQRHSDFSIYNLESRHFKVVSEKLKRKITGEYDYTEDYHGWQPGPAFSKALMPMFERENKKYAKIETVPSYEQAVVNEKLIEDEAEWCNRHGVRYVLITPPHWKSFVSLLSRPQIDKNHEIIYRLQQRYSIIYLDYLEDKRFIESDFGDGTHLTVNGAMKYSAILAKDLEHAF